MSQLKQLVEKKSPGAYQQLWAADPSSRKTAVSWLCKLFLADKLPLEDLPKATTYLPVFFKYRQNLKLKKLEEYNNLPSLFLAIERFMPKQEELPEVENGEDHDDVKVLYDKDGLSIKIPLSTEAAQRLGKGTQWCTAYTDAPNEFEKYNRDGPLIIIKTPRVNGKKQRYQFHLETAQFHDEAGSGIDVGELIKRYPVIATVIRPQVEDMVKKSYTLSDDPLVLLPYSLIDQSLCELALKVNGRSLEYVPEEFLEHNRRKLYEIALSEDGTALEFIPDEDRDRSLYEMAVKQNGYAIDAVHPDDVDQSLLEMAVEQEEQVLQSAHYNLGHLIDRDFCERIARKNPKALLHLPEHYHDRFSPEVRACIELAASSPSSTSWESRMQTGSNQPSDKASRFAK